jgi:hypothetical protein
MRDLAVVAVVAVVFHSARGGGFVSQTQPLSFDRNAIAAFVSKCAQSGDLDTCSIEDLARRFEASLGTSYGGTGDSQPSLVELINRHQDQMNRIYDARDRELDSAWRVGK